MTPPSSYLSRLPPELYPNIATQLPLSSTPSTLLALALVNHTIFDIVLPLLYSCLVLKNESDALRVIKRLQDSKLLGNSVTEIHILSELSSATRAGENPFNVITGLEKLITATSLQYMHTLSIHLLNGWHHYACHYVQIDRFRRVFGFRRFRSAFWINVRKNCPRLRRLVLRDIADDEEDPWVNDASSLRLFELQDITNLSLIFKNFTLPQAGCGKLLQNIDRLSFNLHTLDFAPNCSESTSISPLLAMTFPKLVSLSLASFVLENSAQAMEFWTRHPSLEYLKIFDAEDLTPWFLGDSVISQSFLPNLKHLKAPFYDVRPLSPILNQLVSLTVYNSINAQVPYLLRAVLPDGLPNLKSLDIGQKPSNSGKNINIEGALWYEREDGKFGEADVTKARREVLDGYIPSIARGAPNLEEIGFHLKRIGLDEFAEIASEVAYLSKLRRFYLEGWDMEPEIMVSNARIIAEKCKGLRMIVDRSPASLPYGVARISRTESGEVSRIDMGTGFGMQVGSEDDPFPG